MDTFAYPPSSNLRVSHSTPTKVRGQMVPLHLLPLLSPPQLSLPPSCSLLPISGTFVPVAVVAEQAL